MNLPLDLSIHFLPPPAGSPAEVLASIALRFDFAGLTHTGDVLLNPFTPQEQEDLRWYLEEYPEWPYEQFLERARKIEAALPELGKRLYSAVFGSAGAMSVAQAWRLCPLPSGGQRQISIISEIPRVLSLPWELLHDEQGFLVLRTRHPVVLIRRLPRHELTAFPTPFEPPLRILLVTARPAGVGFVDPRSIAREVLDELQPQIDAGTIALEFLRPPTLPALRSRLSDPAKPAIHILHFDGHGIFDTKQSQGMLAFEDADGRLDRVKAETVAQVLQDSGVRLAVLTACESAQSSADDAFSSVAARLIGSGVDAVSAMSATVCVVSATRYVEAFYRALAAGVATPLAQERARQALHDDPRRHMHHRRADSEGTPVLLHDWWVSHYYQQRPVSLQPTKIRRKKRKLAPAPAFSRLSPDFPPEPRYRFSGRARELLQIERALLQKKFVVIAGFGGIGKTALVREAADWLTRTGMYDGACFVSFEHGGDAPTLLSILGNYMGINGANYHPHEPATALIRLNSALKGKKVLLVADNLENILPKGEVPLEPAERAALWDVLLKLREMGVGLLLTSRERALGDGRLGPGKWTRQVLLRGLAPHDAYALASRLLTDLGIDRSRAPYAELRDLLAQLDHHPLAIQLVLPALRDLPLSIIRAEFATRLPRFVDDRETGRNRSLLASLDYSLRRLSEEQRILLARLAVFEGGASEDDLLAITEIPKATWTMLRSALEQVALITAKRVHEDVRVPFLHFHPILVPYLRNLQEAEDAVLLQRYTRRYHAVANLLSKQDAYDPEVIRALARYELPNLRKALELLLRNNEVEAASDMAESVVKFLTNFGLTWERDQIRQQITDAMRVPGSEGSVLTYAEYLHESGRAEDEWSKGDLQAAIVRLTRILSRIGAQPAGERTGPGSYAHCITLQLLARCLEDDQRFVDAEQHYRNALAIIEGLLKQDSEEQGYLAQHALLLCDLGDVLSQQGHYTQAKESYETALKVYTGINHLRGQSIVLTQMGYLAFLQHNYSEAQLYYHKALGHFSTLDEPANESIGWYQLGMIAREQEEWTEAERCYRKGLALEEQLGNLAGAAVTCNQLAVVAENAERPAEAEGWYRRALELYERVEPESIAQARVLNNLADLLLNEIRAGRTSETRLAEAQNYAEHSLRIKERPGILAETWKTFDVLARIADLEGQQEIAQNYHRRDRESFATFAGNRYQVDQQFALLIPVIVAATKGDEKAQVELETVWPELEQHGWHITTAVQRIWAGERDWHTLVEDIDRGSALLIRRVLENVAESPETPSSGVERWQATDDGRAEKADV